jgi:hypothetical protein
MKQSNIQQEAVKKVSLRMSGDLAAEVSLLAKDDKRSFNQMVNILLERAVAHKTKGQSDGSARSGS